MKKTKPTIKYYELQNTVENIEDCLHELYVCFKETKEKTKKEPTFDDMLNDKKYFKNAKIKQLKKGVNVTYKNITLHFKKIGNELQIYKNVTAKINRKNIEITVFGQRKQ